MNVSFERPVLLSGSMEKYEHLKQISPEIIKHFRHNSRHSFTEDMSAKSTDSDSPNKLFNELTFKSTQFIFAHNWKCNDKVYGVKFGIRSSTSSFNYEKLTSHQVMNIKLHINRMGLTFLKMFPANTLRDSVGGSLITVSGSPYHEIEETVVGDSVGGSLITVSGSPYHEIEETVVTEDQELETVQLN